MSCKTLSVLGFLSCCRFCPRAWQRASSSLLFVNSRPYVCTPGKGVHELFCVVCTSRMAEIQKPSTKTLCKLSNRRDRSDKRGKSVRESSNSPILISRAYLVDRSSHAHPIKLCRLRMRRVQLTILTTLSTTDNSCQQLTHFTNC